MPSWLFYCVLSCPTIPRTDEQSPNDLEQRGAKRPRADSNGERTAVFSSTQGLQSCDPQLQVKGPQPATCLRQDPHTCTSALRLTGRKREGAHYRSGWPMLAASCRLTSTSYCMNSRWRRRDSTAGELLVFCRRKNAVRMRSNCRGVLQWQIHLLNLLSAPNSPPSQLNKAASVSIKVSSPSPSL